jgi:glutamyl-tRNA reductase
MAEGGTTRTTPPQTPHRAFAVGVSFRTADARLRDRLYIEEQAVPAFLETARDAGLTSTLALSTCDRIEVIGTAPEGEDASRVAEGLLRARIADRTPDGAFYRLHDIEAVRHFFRIACALDSQMIGESQILGQLKTATKQAEDLGLISSDLEALANAAFALAKRVRGTTRIGEGAVSAAAAAVKVARDLHGNLAKRRALLLGLGETGGLIAEQFQRSGIGLVDLTGPARRTEREARRRGLTFVPYDELDGHLPSCDVVITAAGQGRYVLDRDKMSRALSARRSKPVLIVDAGVPADVDPDVDRLEDVFLYTLNDIERLAEKGQLDRKAEAMEAEAMVDSAVVDWRRAQAEREGVPGLIALRERFDALREEVLTRHPNADPAEATRLLVNRLLHEPSEMLRAIAADGGAADMRDTITVNRVLERLFALKIQEDGNNEK